MRNLRLSQQMILMAVLGILLPLLVSLYTLWGVKKETLERYKLVTQGYTNVAYSVLETYDDLVQEGIIPSQKIAVMQAAKIFERVHGQNDRGVSYSIFNSKGVSIVDRNHNPGENILNLDDAKGNAYIANYMDVAQKNPEGALAVSSFDKEGTPITRYTYVRYFAPFKIYIASFLYPSGVHEEFMQSVKLLSILFVWFAVVIALCMFLMYSNFARPIIRLHETIQDIVIKKDLSTDVPYLTLKSEIGMLANSLETFKTRVREINEERDRQRMLEIEYQNKQKDTIRDVATTFENQVGQSVNDIYAVSDVLRNASDNMSRAASESERLSRNVLDASDRSAGNVQSVASATEELSASIGEITSQVGQSTEMTSKAVVEAEQVNSTVNSLNEAASRVGEVVDLIASIAEQTNLLALNATIEAARAGDAGKGFTVVASEVKSLASRTAKATEEISTQIADMQKSTKASVGAISKITEIVGEINNVISGIAAAVEEQSAATQEISRNAEFASVSTQETRQNVEEVLQAIQETNSVSENILEVSSDLQLRTNELQHATAAFMEQLHKDSHEDSV